jgi:hypothetical protein
MTDDDDMEALAQALGRYRQQLDDLPPDWEARAPEWAAVARGELSVEAAVEARRMAGDDPAEIERARAVFTAISVSDDDELVAGAISRIREHEHADTKPIEPAANGPGGRKWLVILLAVAAALVLWRIIVSIPDFNQPQLASVSLPTYRLEADPGHQQSRSVEPKPGLERHYRPQNNFRWIMKPAINVDEALDVRVFAFSDDGDARELAIPDRKVSPTGSVRLTGMVSDLGLQPGHWRVVIVVGLPSALPGAAELGSNAEGTGAWRAQWLDLTIEE